jgi:hypothetical protein
MSNVELPQQLPFDTRFSKWTKFKRLVNLDEQQINGTMIERTLRVLIDWTLRN